MKPHKHLPDILEMARLRLGLLGDGVDIAKAFLKRVFVKDGGGPRRLIGSGHCIARLADAVATGEPQPGALGQRPLFRRHVAPNKDPDAFMQIGAG